jgi:hypothetical protein
MFTCITLMITILICIINMGYNITIGNPIALALSCEIFIGAFIILCVRLLEDMIDGAHLFKN